MKWWGWILVGIIVGVGCAYLWTEWRIDTIKNESEKKVQKWRDNHAEALLKLESGRLERQGLKDSIAVLNTEEALINNDINHLKNEKNRTINWAVGTDVYNGMDSLLRTAGVR